MRSLLVGLTASFLMLAAVPATAQAPPSPRAAAVLAVAEDGRTRLVLADAGGAVRALTEGPHDVAPVADPDGGRAAFVRLDAEGDEQGEIHLVDLWTGEVTATGIPVDRSTPLRWVSLDALVATTDAGVVRIIPDARFSEFVDGTVAGHVAQDVVPAADGRPFRVLVSRSAAEGQPVQLLELVPGSPPALLWRASPQERTAVAAAAYGPAGGIAFVSTISSIGFGTQQYLGFVDPQGDVVDDDALYGGDGPVNLMSGPWWRPQGAEVLLGGAGRSRFPGLETEPATLLVEAPGEQGDTTVTTREQPTELGALGWTADGSRVVAVRDDPDAGGALLVLDTGGEVRAEVPLPGRVDVTASPARFGAADADLLPAIRRVAGPARADTAVEVSQRTFPSATDRGEPLAERVVLARADVYADALAGAPLARHLDAPLLLTGSAELTPVLAEEIRRLGATEAVLLGGTAAIGEGVERDLGELGIAIDRVAGADRFATAAAVAARLPAPTEAVVVQGIDADPTRGWPDAVAAAPLAAAGGAALLLTATDELPPATAEALAALGPEAVTVVGGTAAVSAQVADAAAETAGAPVTRLAGATRVGTSVAVARAQVARGTGSATSPWLATATDWPDALTAGPAVAADGGVLVLVPPGAGDSELLGFLDDAPAEVVRLVGGERAMGGPELGAVLRRRAFGITVEAIDVP